MNYVIKENINEVDVDDVSKLFFEIWGGNLKRTESKTFWAFNTKPSYVLTAYDNNKLIAVRGGFEWKFCVKNDIISACQVHGACVHKDYRRVGLFSLLTKQYVDGLIKQKKELLFNVSVLASRLGNEKLGWRYIKGLHRLTYFKNFRSFVSEFKNRGKDNHYFESIKPQVETDISDVFLVERNKHLRKFIHTEYTRDFFLWRISNKEEGYHILQNSYGAVVYKIRIMNGLKKLVVGEYFLKEKSLKVFRKVHKDLLRHEQPEIVYTYMTKSHPYYSYTLLSGFLLNPLNYNLNMGVRWLDTEKQEKLKNEKWALSFIDIDTF